MNRTFLVPAVATAALALTLALALSGISPGLAVAACVGGIVLVWIVSGKGETPPSAPAASSKPPPAEAEPETPSPGPAAAGEAEHALAGEFAAAGEIQMRLVPHTFPPLPGCPPFDLFALIEPTREIGGDFYDYWMLGRERLALVIADVSGKGLPAALYMAMARTYLRAFSRYVHDPAKLLERLNREVARHNPDCMFVSVFCAVVNLETGVMEYANAGHNPPLRKAPGSAPEYFEMASNPPVGFNEDLRFANAETRLAPGEMLFLYTDGVTEAKNAAGSMFDEDRVGEAFAAAADTADACRAVVMQIRSEVAEFVGDADQYDDITMMAYRHPDSGDWRADCADAGQIAEGGDSAMLTLGGDALASLAGMSPGRAGGDKFYSLTDLK